MAKAKQTGKDGVDRWTNNGKGLVNIKPAISKAQAQAIAKEKKVKK